MEGREDEETHQIHLRIQDKHIYASTFSIQQFTDKFIYLFMQVKR